MQANRYIKLNEAEIVTLEEGVKNHKKAYFRMRCESLLLSNRGYKIEEIARLFEVRTHTVRFWMNRWENHGIVGLQIAKGRGRKAGICLADVSLVEALEAQVALHPQSLETVGEQIKQQRDISLSKGQIKAFLKKS